MQLMRSCQKDIQTDQICYPTDNEQILGHFTGLQPGAPLLPRQRVRQDKDEGAHGQLRQDREGPADGRGRRTTQENCGRFENCQKKKV